MTDQQWLDQLRSTDTDVRDSAIAQLRALLLRGLSQSLNNRYGQPFSAEDIVQDALMKILENLGQFEARSKFTTWAMTVATRIGISSLRRKHNQDVSMEAFSDDNGSRMEIGVTLDRDVGKNEHRMILFEKLQFLIDEELTDKQRNAMQGFLSGSSTDTIADNLGANRNSVYKLIHDARLRLKNGFEKAGISADDVLSSIA